jgi:hypothetical protein
MRSAEPATEAPGNSLLLLTERLYLLADSC